MLTGARQRLWGFAALLATAWVAMYGKLGSFERYAAHRFTAKAILTGTLRLRTGLAHLGTDEQFHDGAGYTNWGYGVPLLQIPFHALATAAGFLHGFFPDRGIFFVYVAIFVAVQWAAFDALVAMRTSENVPCSERHSLSLAATFLVVARVLFPLMSTRFLVYEETLAYFDIFELLAVGAYVFALRSSWSAASVCALGLTSATALLIRPTGALYFAAWAVIVALERRPRVLLAFSAVAAPLVGFWLYSNQVRTGTPLGLGYQNTNPWWPYHTPLERFGSQCADTPVHALEAGARLFTGLFLFVSQDPLVPWLKTCHFDFEERDGVLPFLGLPALIVLGWAFFRYAKRRERRLALYLPYGILAVFFVSLVHRGQGFAWRYAGDLWPAIVLVCVQYIGTLPSPPADRLDGRLAKGMAAYGLFVFLWFLVPWGWATRPELLEPAAVETLEDEFQSSRYGANAPVPSTLRCEDHPTPFMVDGKVWDPFVPARPDAARPEWLFHNGLGWRHDCGVDAFTNVYLGVPGPKKPGEPYEIRLSTEGMSAPSFLVYLNGKTYVAEGAGGSYRANVAIDYRKLTSPIVLATVLWTRETASPPRGRLLSIELR